MLLRSSRGSERNRKGGAAVRGRWDAMVMLMKGVYGADLSCCVT